MIKWILEDKVVLFTLKKTFLVKNVQSISKIYHEFLLLVKFLQTKPQVRNMNIKYYDFYYTVFKREMI